MEEIRSGGGFYLLLGQPSLHGGAVLVELTGLMLVVFAGNIDHPERDLPRHFGRFL